MSVCRLKPEEIYIDLYRILEPSFKTEYRTVIVYDYLLENKYINEEGIPLRKEVKITKGILQVNFPLMKRMREDDELIILDKIKKYKSYN